jgi:membrane associated rhomboid family serine protease
MPRIEEAAIQKTPSKVLIGLILLNVITFLVVTLISYPKTRMIVSLTQQIRDIDRRMYEIEKGYIDFGEMIGGISGDIDKEAAVEAFKEKIRQRISDGRIVLSGLSDYERWHLLYKSFTELKNRLREERRGYLFWELGFIPRAPSLLGVMISSLLHAGLFSLFLNMLFLWIVGPWVEEDLGSRTLLLLYIGIGMATSLSNRLISPNSEIPVVGGAGAVAGLMGFFIINYYNVKVRFFFPLHSLLFLVIYLLLQPLKTGIEGDHVVRPQGLLITICGLVLGAGLGVLLKIMEEKAPVEKRRSLYARIVARAHELYTFARFEEAKRLFEKVLAREPDNCDAHIGMGRIYFKWNMNDEAINEYSLAIEIGIREGRDDVIQMYEELRSLSPGAILEPKGQYQLARYMAEKGEHELALRTLEDLIVTYKKDRLVWRSLFDCGKISMKLNRAEKAIDYYEKALARNPDEEWIDIIKREIERAKSIP